jgi:hypothetical protein
MATAAARARTGCVLRAWRQSCPDEDHVLPYSGNMRHLYEDWHKITGRHRVPKNCRSTCGSQVVESGTPTVVVKDFLGHSSVTTTEKFYVNTSASPRKAAELPQAIARRGKTRFYRGQDRSPTECGRRRRLTQNRPNKFHLNCQSILQRYVDIALFG